MYAVCVSKLSFRVASTVLSHPKLAGNEYPTGNLPFSDGNLPFSEGNFVGDGPPKPVARRPHCGRLVPSVARMTNGVAAAAHDAALTAAWATQGASSSEPADREH